MTAQLLVDSLVDRLARHRTLSPAPRRELEWLAAHGVMRELPAGQVVTAKGHPIENLYILLSGWAALFVDRGAGMNKAMEWHAGDVTGMLPYSRLVAPPGDVIVLEPVEILAIPRIHIEELTRECYEVTSILVHIMLDRTRLFTSSELQNEKMISLGKLSAGLAHELNNPASAIERCAAQLEDHLRESTEAARDLAAAGLSPARLAAVDTFRAACKKKTSGPSLSPLEQSDREEVIETCLSGYDVPAALAPMLADTGVTIEAIDYLAAALDFQPEQLNQLNELNQSTQSTRSVFNSVVQWVAADESARNLASLIQDSSMRISSLIIAVKGLTHMDQANVAEPVDVAQSLTSIVAVLTSKAREKSVTVTLDLAPDLPKLHGFAAELNEAWGNLIDNALDAVGYEGSVQIIAARQDQNVVVRVLDDGAGIPAEVRNRVFDPFFTTKPQGQGTGLGLDIARRLIRNYNGAIEFESQPGRTEFRVTLPLATIE